MPFDYGEKKGEPEWPTDDLPGKFDVDDEFKDVEGYVAEYDE